jgi:hypothetical protein
MTTAAAPRTITVSEGLLRRKAVENAVADLRLEALAPSADARVLFEQFVRGELTEEHLVDAVLAQ